MDFDQSYYDGIWGGVHRHDYVPDLAQALVTKYGKCRILDIGTGCGALVKELRSLGCDAWGLEISEYAVSNSCDPLHVRLGEVRNIPYAADRFDVVFSSGLWCHIPEEDIAKAWKECNRVGKVQEHQIDYEDAPSDIPYFVTRKSEEWWKNQFYPKVLVACPTHELKEYAIAAWIDCVKKLDYPNYDILLADNSLTPEFYNRWKEKAPMVRPELPREVLVGDDNPGPRINMSMEYLRKHFLAGDYAFWFNLEADNIVPPETLKQLLKYADVADWVSHSYPVRGGTNLVGGIGVALWNRKLLENFSWEGGYHSAGPDGWMWQELQLKCRTLEMHQFLPVKHLGTGNGSGNIPFPA